jgi:NAD(P)-dependent dehydrogenase (short-subunit alcohol dehydrogenase family)
MGRLSGKVAIISGGARGMGEAHGRLFAEQGACVVLGDVLDREGEAAASSLQRLGFRVHYRHLDVTSESAWQAAVEFAEMQWGKLDILVNNAAIVGSRRALDQEIEEDWQRVTEINQRGTWLGMKSCVPAMQRAGGGSIVNISSMNGIVGMPDYFSYQASKGAVRMMSKSAALTYARDHIRVNTVCPGLIATPMGEEDGADANKAFIAATPLARAGDPLDVSYGVLFLASDESRYITATELVIDGGYSAQ